MIVHLQIDAWLDWAGGGLRILDTDRGHELLYFDRQQVCAAMDRGDLDPAVLGRWPLGDAEILQLVADLGEPA